MTGKQKIYNYIYKTTCNVNGKYYIGMHSTDDIDDGYLGSGKRLWNSINCYGKETHTKEIIEFVENREELIKREIEIVNEKLLSDELCMNLQLGGGGGFSSEEHRRKFIENNNWLPSHKKIKWLSENDNKWLEEKRKKIIMSLKEINFDHNTFGGRTHTEETKRKISEKNSFNQMGSKNSQYGTCWINNGKETKKIKKEEINYYLCIGWTKGRKMAP